MEVNKSKIEELEKEVRELRNPIIEIEKEISNLQKLLQKEQLKIANREDNINVELKYLKYLDYLYRSETPVVIVENVSEDSNVSGYFIYWDYQKEKIKDEYDIKECLIEIQYSTPYYACGNSDDKPAYKDNPTSITITHNGEIIKADDSQVNYTKILEYYCDYDFETLGDSDGLYDTLTVSLKCLVYIKK